MRLGLKKTLINSLIALLAFTMAACTVGSGQFPLLSATTNPPAINELSPNNAPVGSPAFTLIVKGSNFDPSAVVFWKDTALRTTFINSGELMAQITDTDMQMAGLTPVFVRTSGQNSNAVNFDVLIQ